MTIFRHKQVEIASNITSLQSFVEHMVVHLNLPPTLMVSPQPSTLDTSADSVSYVLPRTSVDSLQTRHPMGYLIPPWNSDKG